MAKKRPFVAMLLIIAILVLITFLSLGADAGITGLAVYENLRSIASQDILAAVGPIVIFIILFSAGIAALRKQSKE